MVGGIRKVDGAISPNNLFHIEDHSVLEEMISGLLRGEKGSPLVVTSLCHIDHCTQQGQRGCRIRPP